MNPDSKSSVATAIAEAARELSAIEPRGHMASRVLAHLGPQRRWHWRPAFVVAIGCAAVVILAIFVAGVTGVTPPEGVPTTTSLNPSAAPVPPVAPVPSVNAAPRHDLARNTPTSRRAAGPPEDVPDSAAEAAWRSRAVPALPAIEPIEGQVSQPEPIDLPLLQLKPLETPPIQLARLDGGRS